MADKEPSFYDETKAKRLKHYTKELDKDTTPKLTKGFREYAADPLSDAVGKLIPKGKPDEWEKADRDARKEVLGYKKGGSVSSASKRADGIAVKGKTRGKIC